MNRRTDSPGGCLQRPGQTGAADSSRDAEADPLTERADGEAIRQVTRLVEGLNGDPHFRKHVSEFGNTTVVLNATDTGRGIIIVLDGQGVRVRPYAGERFDVKIEATEEVHLSVLSGKMDADAAFFAGRVRISGSVLAAFRVKNKFLSLLQRHWAGEAEALSRLVEAIDKRGDGNE